MQCIFNQGIFSLRFQHSGQALGLFLVAVFYLQLFKDPKSTILSQYLVRKEQLIVKYDPRLCKLSQPIILFLNTDTIIATFFSFFFSLLLESDFYLFPTLEQLSQSDLESQFFVRSQLGSSIQSGSSPCAGLQLVTQSAHLLKDCYPQLVLN